MADIQKNPFDLLIAEIREVVRSEVKAALAERRPEKLQYTTKEASEMLNVPESWLAAKARAREVPYRMCGHYRYFSLDDIKTIIDNGSVPMVHIEYDGRGVSADSKTAQAKPSKAGGGDGDHRDDGGALGAK